jgi:hypothetical protein
MRMRRWVVLAAVVTAVAATAYGGSASAQPDARFLVAAWQTKTSPYVRLEVVDGGGRVLQVLSKSTLYWTARVSPNHELVSFGTATGLVVEGVDGTGRRLVVSVHKPCGHHVRCIPPMGVWSPDSAKLLVTNFELHRGQYRTWLSVVSVATGRSHRIVGPRYETRYAALAWSGPANRIAYISEREYTPSLVTAGPDGRARHTICGACGTPADDPSLDWSPDGKWIAYTPGGSASLDIYDVAAGTTTEVRHVGGVPPLWAPDSSNVAAETGSGVKYFSPSGAVVATAPVTGAFFLARNADGIYFVTDGNPNELFVLPDGQSSARTAFSLPAKQAILWAEPLQ